MTTAISKTASQLLADNLVALLSFCELIPSNPSEVVLGKIKYAAELLGEGIAQQYGVSPALVTAAPALLHAAQCAMAYNEALKRHAAKGEQWVDDGELDNLYEHWMNASAGAIKLATEGQS